MTTRLSHDGDGGDALTDPARLIRFGACVAVGMVAAFVIFLLTANGVEAMAGGRLGGDWAAFYVAGELARTAPELVLDPSAQAASQAEYLGGEFAPFPYPPVLAYVFAPLSMLSFRASYAIYVVLMAGAGFWAVQRTLDVLGVEDSRWRGVGILGAMTYAPMFLSVGGAQNATLTLLILASGVWLLWQDREVTAGLVFGLLWFKPQFAVPVAGLLVVSRRWTRVGLVSLLPGAALWTISAVLLGIDWVQVWWREIISITNVGNKAFNTNASVSLVEYIRGRVPGDPGEALGVGLALLVGLLLATVVRHEGDRPATFLTLACAGVLLTALHALTYELVLLVPVIGMGLAGRTPSDLRAGLAVYCAAWLMLVPLHPVMRVAYVVAVISWGLRAAGVDALLMLRDVRRRAARPRASR